MEVSSFLYSHIWEELPKVEIWAPPDGMRFKRVGVENIRPKKTLNAQFQELNAPNGGNLGFTEACANSIPIQRQMLL